MDVWYYAIDKTNGEDFIYCINEEGNAIIGGMTFPSEYFSKKYFRITNLGILEKDETEYEELQRATSTIYGNVFTSLAIVFTLYIISMYVFFWS